MKPYALPPEGPTYRWECNDSLEADWVGDTNSGPGAIQLTKREARQHTTLTGHETLVWKLLTSYLSEGETNG